MTGPSGQVEVVRDENQDLRDDGTATKRLSGKHYGERTVQ